MKRLVLLSFAALLIALAASAETIRFNPPNPNPHASVDAIVSGSWSSGCTPSANGFLVSGSTITLQLDGNVMIGILCTALITPYSLTFHLGVLPSGSYNVIAVVTERGAQRQLAQATLIVRDAEKLSIAPYAVPTSGGQIAIGNPFFPTRVVVLIGGMEVPASSDVDGLLIANAPPHAPGAVDVAIFTTICAGFCDTVASKAGLIYYDPAAADPAVFEPILFPVSFDGAGAFGSQWTTESYISTLAPAYFRDVLPCGGCTNSLSIGMKRLDNDSSPWGHVLYAMRDTTDVLFDSSRIRDLSRQAQSAGTEIPVVRESAFRARDLRLLNVPADAHFRAMLRVWSLADVAQLIVNVESQSSLVTMTKIPGTTLSFGSMDVTPLLQKASSSPTAVQVYPAAFRLQVPLWGMISLTNNDTQQVTIISAQ